MPPGTDPVGGSYGALPPIEPLPPEPPGIIIKGGTLFGPKGSAISSMDIDQDKINDCNLLSRLSGMADQQPEVIENAIKFVPAHDGKEDSYDVTLYNRVLGKPGKVEAKQYNVSKSEILDNFARGGASKMDNGAGENGAFWPAVIETAYAKQHIPPGGTLSDGYNVIDKGGRDSEAEFALTGRAGTVLRKDMSPEQTGKVINELLQEGRVVTIGSGEKSPLPTNGLNLIGVQQGDGLHQRHGYQVLSCFDSNGTMMVRVSNPNATGEGDSGIESTTEVTLASILETDEDSILFGQKSAKATAMDASRIAQGLPPRTPILTGSKNPDPPPTHSSKEPEPTLTQTAFGAFRKVADSVMYSLFGDAPPPLPTVPSKGPPPLPSVPPKGPPPLPTFPGE
jgi:hypothetical protein